MNELTDRKRYCDVIFEIGEPLIQISNEANNPGWSNESLEKSLAADVTWKFDSLDEIAERFGMPNDALAKQMEDYNSYVASGVDEQFGKTIPENAQPVEPPYLVTRLWPKVHHTMGGVKTDVDCRVMNAHLQPIPGLFAAGEYARAACTVPAAWAPWPRPICLVNGRIAGQQAAAMDPVA